MKANSTLAANKTVAAVKSLTSSNIAVAMVKLNNLIRATFVVAPRHIHWRIRLNDAVVERFTTPPAWDVVMTKRLTL